VKFRMVLKLTLIYADIVASFLIDPSLLHCSKGDSVDSRLGGPTL